MADMFDDVSGRYDLLNRLMTLGQDGAWRRAMWRAVPSSARVVLDLCTGSGVSLPGLARPGRLVLGVDVSLGMLEQAAGEVGTGGWQPRLACADAFRLPLRDGALDAVTVAFGMRNLRPRPAALAELRRVLRPGGALVVLEAAAPAPGLRGALHAVWLRHVVPLLGRLSADPSAYEYLSASIFEFGAGPAFERDLAAAGFLRTGGTRFLFGATRLWVARAMGTSLAPTPGPALAGVSARGGSAPPDRGATVQDARPDVVQGREIAHPPPGRDAEWVSWTLVQAALSIALVAALLYGLVVYAKYHLALPLDPWQRGGLWVLMALGAVAFAIRAVLLLLRLQGPPPRL